MRAVLQRVSAAKVEVDGETVGATAGGLMILLGVKDGDGKKEAEWLAAKAANLRIFGDEEGKMNLSVLDVGGSALVVSQFTLYGDCSKGRRPSFVDAASPQQADELYQYFCQCLADQGCPVETGRFQTTMQVSLTNDGPVTLILESP
ncbi:MAG: D-tyrosyl-tRNA(Tyr) deacylase [Candidatus Eremiobacteraeota bacterium]|nr:D-tyrosyl-tRNA(Tyr) deacylase [Candidatus Eremiobacteraeota bacterium]